MPVDLDAPALHLAPSAVDRIDAGSGVGVVDPVAGTVDQPEALGLEPRFGLFDSLELVFGFHAAPPCCLATASAKARVGKGPLRSGRISNIPSSRSMTANWFANG